MSFGPGLPMIERFDGARAITDRMDPIFCIKKHRGQSTMLRHVGILGKCPRNRTHQILDWLPVSIDLRSGKGSSGCNWGSWVGAAAIVVDRDIFNLEKERIINLHLIDKNKGGLQWRKRQRWVKGSDRPVVK